MSDGNPETKSNSRQIITRVVWFSCDVSEPSYERSGLMISAVSDETMLPFTM
jgi:hypothetical protein